MPPKKSQNASSKTFDKQKKQSVEDKTFGLKNKNKSKKVQEFISVVKKQADDTTNKKKAAAGLDKNKEKAELMRKKKLLMEMKKKELEVLFKPVEKKAKIDVYVDQREQMGEEIEDSMDNWDLAKLEAVVKQKHKQSNQTTIICKHFLKAIEDGKYGWFWICPAGGDNCKYRHALPPGFVLKKKDTGNENKNVQSLEDFIEEERRKLPEMLTPVTEDSFKKWKEGRLKETQVAEDKKLKELESMIQAGKAQGLSGRQLFSFVPQFKEFQEDEGEEAFDLSKYKQNQDDEIDESLFEDENLDDVDVDE